jgi:adenylate cyclase
MTNITNKEIERKFLVQDPSFLSTLNGKFIAQGYLNASPERIVRVRICEDNAWITIKSKRQNFTCSEFEYAIPLDDAKQLLTLSETTPIEKTRFCVHHEGHIWEVDVFEGSNQGLIIAEIELTNESEPFEKPSWLGEEVSTDSRYLNNNLSKKPFTSW